MVAKNLVCSEKLRKAKLYQATSTKSFGNLALTQHGENAEVNLVRLIRALGLDLKHISLFILPDCHSVNVAQVEISTRMGWHILRQGAKEIVKFEKFSTSNDLPRQQGINVCITRAPNIFLGVLHADNAPVIFYEPNTCIFAITSVGFSEVSAGIIKNTIECMRDWCYVKPGDIIAYIGPCLSGGDLNLKENIVSQIKVMGVSNIEISPLSTDLNSELFFSDYLAEKKEGEKGKNLTVVGF